MALNFTSGLAIFIGGVVLTTSIYQLAVPKAQEVKIFQRENGKPAVMRLYMGNSIIDTEDSLLVESVMSEKHKTFLKEKGIYDDLAPPKYIPLGEYLEKIPYGADRHVEEELVKKAAEWYKE